MERKGGWLQTATGGRFYPLDPHPDDIKIEDIAAALSKLCRFGGHCDYFYSVAEHCVLMANHADPVLGLCVLLHDASEAYLADIPRPVKKLLADYNNLEDSIMEAISAKFGTPWPLPKEVKDLDVAMLFTEREQNMRPTPDEWENEQPGLPIVLQFWKPSFAEYNFLQAFNKLKAVKYAEA